MATQNKEQLKILIICESPTKAKHIRKFLPSNYIVTASRGHITRLADVGEYNIGIDFKNNFKPTYEVPDEKKATVSKLKEQAKFADRIILLSDPDREGEAISWHLKEELKIPKSKYVRCTTHEITKASILKALDNPRDLDLDLIASALSREATDKIIGYRLSGIARNNIGARSVGRCQSAGLKLVVDREKEIQAFNSKKYFDLYLHFKKNKNEFKAKYTGTDDKPIKNFESLDACIPVVNDCKKGKYTILDIQKKDSIENPKPPFITTTLQQEVARRLGLSVKSVMDCAQKLFESGLITYHRTDSTDLDITFVDSVEKFISENCDKKLFIGQKEHKKAKGEQAGHEAIRPADINLTPELFNKKSDNSLYNKVYALIWERTVQSLLRPCIYAVCEYIIANGVHRFAFSTKEIKDPGFRAVTVLKEEREEDNTTK